MQESTTQTIEKPEPEKVDFRVARAKRQIDEYAAESERLETKQAAIEKRKRGKTWTRRQIRPISFAQSVLLRKADRCATRIERLTPKRVAA